MALKLLFFSRPPSGDSYVAQRGRHPVTVHNLSGADLLDDASGDIVVLVERELCAAKSRNRGGERVEECGECRRRGLESRRR
jgi:hypothetical protein